jgi:hypothetical protein
MVHYLFIYLMHIVCHSITNIIIIIITITINMRSHWVNSPPVLRSGATSWVMRRTSTKWRCYATLKTWEIPSDDSCLADVTEDRVGFLFWLLFLSVIWPLVIWAGAWVGGRSLQVDLDNRPPVVESNYDGESPSICSLQIGSCYKITFSFYLIPTTRHTTQIQIYSLHSSRLRRRANCQYLLTVPESTARVRQCQQTRTTVYWRIRQQALSKCQ